MAAGDPANVEPLQAAEIVFGAPFEIVTASFEDIATVLGDKLDAADATAAGGRAHEAGGADENVDNLRDLASGAPVMRAVNDAAERVEQRLVGHMRRVARGKLRRCPLAGLPRPAKEIEIKRIGGPRPA